MRTHYQAQHISRGFDTLGQMGAKIRILIGSKIGNKARIQKACKKMDNLRQGLAKRTEGFYR